MIPFASVLFTLLREFTDKRLTAKEITEEKLIPQPPVLRSGFKEQRKKREKHLFKTNRKAL